MGKSKKGKFEERWSGDEIKNFNKLLLSKEGVFEGKVVARGADEFVDMRGFVFIENIKRIQIENIDFSFGKFSSFGQLNFCRVRNCKFNEGDFGTNLGNYFKDCVFDKAKMNGVVLRGEFINCSFFGANLSGCKGVGVKIFNCNFNKSNLKKIILNDCVFNSCSFDGIKLGQYLDIGSFSGSSFNDCGVGEFDFRGYLLNKTIFNPRCTVRMSGKG